MSVTQVVPTDWDQDLPVGERKRYYKTADGDVLYEKEDEPGVFYDGQDNPISYAAALSAGLISNPAIHTGDATIAGDSNYQFAGSSQAEDEADEDYEEERDRLRPLPATIATLDPEQPLSVPIVADLRSFQSQTTLLLPPDFEVKPKKFFQVGRVFRYLCSEAMGMNALAQSNDSNDGKNDQSVYSTLRPMIVVKKLEAHAICVPVFSYGGQGVGKPGLKAAEVLRHAIVHMAGRAPVLVEREQHWERTRRIRIEDAFTVHPAPEAISLHKASRIRFDSPYTVKYNLKVLDLGVVLRAHRQRLQECWRNANA